MAFIITQSKPKKKSSFLKGLDNKNVLAILVMRWSLSFHKRKPPQDSSQILRGFLTKPVG